MWKVRGEGRPHGDWVLYGTYGVKEPELLKAYRARKQHWNCASEYWNDYFFDSIYYLKFCKIFITIY